MFGQAGFEVFTVAEKPDPITTNMGMTATPKYTFANYPKPDILVVPGGGVPRHQDKPNVIFMQNFAREVVSHEGGVDHWEDKWKVQTDASAAEVLAQIDQSLATTDMWTRQDAAKSNGTVKSLWQFSGKDGKIWNNETLQARQPSYP